MRRLFRGLGVDELVDDGLSEDEGEVDVSSVEPQGESVEA